MTENFFFLFKLVIYVKIERIIDYTESPVVLCILANYLEKVHTTSLPPFHTHITIHFKLVFSFQLVSVQYKYHLAV